MTLALTLAVMQATGLAARFEARDLPALARALADEQAPGEEHALFADLLALVSCRPQSSLEKGASLPRLLVRAEAARGARLLQTAHTAGTVWDELRRRDAFRRELPEQKGRGALLAWPDEGERWPDEEKPLPSALFEWRCDAPQAAADELDVLTPGTVEALDRAAKADAQYAAVAAQVRWQRAVRLLSLGRREEAAAAARLVDPATLAPELKPWALLLRLELSVEPEERWASLLETLAPEAVHTAALLHVAQAQALRGEWRPLVGLSSSAAPSSEAAAEHLLFLRTLARLRLQEESTRAVLTDAFAARQPSPALVDLALAALAQGPLHQDDLAFAKKLFAGQHRIVERLASRALAAGNLDGAARAASLLAAEHDPGTRAQGLALQAEIALRRGDVASWERTLAVLYADADEAPRRVRDARDGAVAAFAPRWVLETSGPPAVRVRRRLASLAEQMSRRERTEVERALAQGDGARVVNAGTVEIALDASLPPVPELQLDWPEPYSLLAIPGSDGALHSWIGRSR